MQASDLRSNEVSFPELHLYGFAAVYPNTQWERPVWFWPPPALSALCLCVCVCVGPLCPGLFHMCLTLLWQGCPASQGRWRMSETRVEKRTASQHLGGMRNTLAAWLACDATAWEQSKGWRPSETPNVCVKYHSCAHLIPYLCTYPVRLPRITHKRTYGAHRHTHTQAISSLFRTHLHFQVSGFTGEIDPICSIYDWASLEISCSIWLIILLKWLQHVQDWQTTNGILSYTLQKWGKFPEHRTTQSLMLLQTNVTTSYVLLLNCCRFPTKNKHPFLLLPSLTCFSSPFTSSLAHWPLTLFWPSSLPCPFPLRAPSHLPPPPLHGRKCVQMRVRQRKQLG